MASESHAEKHEQDAQARYSEAMASEATRYEVALEKLNQDHTERVARISDAYTDALGAGSGVPSSSDDIPY